jgi:oxygen-independent coproporphyrinogen-3 oxidase
MALGLYVHIPFCSAICNYCNFNRGLFDAELKNQYVAALREEIRGKGDRDAADTIFFGGGTPSLLDPAEIAEIIDTCRGAFSLSADAEVTLEANPETITPEKLAGFRAAGVNRLSFGVQSLRDEELQRLSRLHSAARAREALGMARGAGFDNVSLDLMMWLPGQSVADWMTSVEGLIALSPEHASLYLLEIYPNAPLRDAMARGRWAVAAEDDAAEMYLQAMEALDRAGYDQYEISNVARPGWESRHNVKYWTDGEWIGFGCGAHSTRKGTREKNVASTSEYIALVGAGGPLAVETRALSARTRLEEALFMGLRMARGVDLASIESRYQTDIWRAYCNELQPFVDQGLLIYDGAHLRLTRPGMLLANEVMAVFVSSPVR